MKNNGVLITCLWHSDQTQQAEDLGLDNINEEDYERRNVWFYHINAFAPARQENNEGPCTYIYTNGTVFMAPFPVELVKKHWESNVDLLANSINNNESIK